MSSDILETAFLWVDGRCINGAKTIGVSCNPIQRKLYLMADDERLIIDCPTRRETRILKDIIHEHIGRLQERA